MSDVTQPTVEKGATPWEDEMPAPPPASDEVKEVVIDGVVEASDFQDVPKFGDVLPLGTYHFRLERFTESEQEAFEDATPEEKLFGNQPQFMVSWVCQQEPHTGLQFLDFVPWVNEEVKEAAKDGNSVARGIYRRRLSRAKSIMEAAEFKPTGTFNFKEFLGWHPEIKIQVGLRSRKQKVDGQLKDTGQKMNFAIQYLSLRRP